jgi:rhamnose transport system permease protein
MTKAFGTWERMLLALLVLLLAGFGLGIDGFMSPYALADSSFNFSEKGLLALAMALLIVAGEIDLSIAATLSLCSLAMGFAMKAGAGLPLMLLAAFGTGAAAGALNGWLVTAYRLPSIVVTIGSLSLYRGIALVVLGDQAITGYPEALSVLGNGYLGDLIGVPWLIVPIEFAILLVMAVAVGVLLHRTVTGRRLVAIGANPIASRFSGIEVDRHRFALFVFAGLMAALAAVLLTGRIGSTRPNIALGWELDAVTMVILGGVAIEGGRGSIVGVLLSVLLLGLFTFALGMANISGIVMAMIVGVLLIVSMVLPRLLRGPRVLL